MYIEHVNGYLPGPSQLIEELINDAIYQLEGLGNLHGPTSSTHGMVETHVIENASLQAVSFTVCPIPMQNPRFTWSFAYQVVVLLREYYRARGWRLLQFMVYRNTPMGEQQIGTGAVDHGFYLERDGLRA